MILKISCSDTNLRQVAVNAVNKLNKKMMVMVNAKKGKRNYSLLFLACMLFLGACGNKSADKLKNDKGADDRKLDTISFSYTEITGIGIDSTYNRRDPSDVIKVGNKYYVWYTRMDKPIRSGYWGNIWYATSEDDGHSWQEEGMALDIGEEGAFDSQSVFTPNILSFNGKFYLYYTGVKPTPGNVDHQFENNSTNDFTAIGLAVADHPDGPFKRSSNNPLIVHSQEPADFDSYRVDDASMLVQDGKIWLYYKGRCIEHGKEGPRRTQMSVAFADHPEGPFKKHSSTLIKKGHEVLIWNQNDGVASLASLSESIYWSEDGLDFSPIQENLSDFPMAPGLYRPHLEDGNIARKIPGWGIAMRQSQGEAHLLRFEMLNYNKGKLH
jgi:hypothetical protein